MKFKKALLLYPFLFALYPGLTLIAHNLSEMELSDSFRSLSVLPLFAIVLIASFYLYFHDWARSALLTTVVLILFFSYGHAYNLLRETTLFGLVIFRHRVLGILWGSLLVLGFWAISQKFLKAEKLAPTLAIVALAALIVPAWNIAEFQSRATEFEEGRSNGQEPASRPQSGAGDMDLPDIYYIILDGYSRDDYLLEHFDYDNSPFLNWLIEEGFYVAQCSQSNYAQTIFSLTSTLNLNYIDAFYEASYASDYQAIRYKQGLKDLLKHSQVREFLERRGYSIIALESGESFSEITDADTYYNLENKSFLQRATQGLNGFEVLFIRSTALSFLTAVSPSIADILLPDLDFPNKLHRELLLFELDILENITKNDSRKFVFAHIVSPHAPLVFGPNGEVLDWVPGYKVGYPNQINYLNIRVKTIIENILEHSERPPIIILQADHGARQYVGDEGRMAILNAYYFPGIEELIMYDTITPVNTFRVIFNEYFGQDFELLEGKSLYSSYLRPLDYSLIPQVGERCK